MSGSGNFGGTTFQSDVAAFVAVHIVTDTKLRWIPNAFDDTPTALSGEVGGPGDDIEVEFGGRIRPVQIQAKHGLQGGKATTDAFESIQKRSTGDGRTLVFLVVDHTASGAVRNDLASDLDRLRSGRTDALKETARALLDLGGEIQSTLSRVHIKVLALDGSSPFDAARAIELLAENLQDPNQALSAWHLLQGDSARICAKRERRTRAALLEAMKAAGIALKPPRPMRQWHDDLRHTKRLLESQDYEAVLSLLRQIEREATPTADRDVLYRIHQHRAAAQLHLGDFASAIISARTALEHNPEGEHGLVILAGALASHGQFNEADKAARRAVELHPQSVNAWLVLLQISLDSGQPPRNVPQSIADSRDYQMGLLRLHVIRGEGEKARTSSEVLLSEGPRTVDMLFYRMEALCVGLGEAAVDEKASRAADIERLATETLKLESMNPNARLHRLLLGRRSMARRILGRLGEAAADIQEIQDRDPHNPDALLQETQLHLSAGRRGQALETLQHHSLVGAPLLTAMRSLLLAEAGQRDAALKDLDATLLALPDAADQDGLRAAAAEAAIELNESTLAQRLLNETTEAYKGTSFYSILAGRLAATLGNLVEAESLYRQAGDRNAAQRDECLAELASQFLKAKRPEDAARVFSETSNLSIGAKRTQVKALIGLNRLADADAIIQGLHGAPLPDWALAYAAEIAVRRNDPTKTIEYLEQLVEREGAGADSRIVLVQTLIRLGETERAHIHAEKLEADQHLEPRERMQLSHLWLHLKDQNRALPIALRAYRSAPHDPEISRGFGAAVLLSNAPPPQPDQVGLDTYVSLKSADGSKLGYVVFSEPAPFRINDELLPAETESLGLMGLRVGDTFVQNAGASFEKRFTVEQILPALTFAFQDVIANYGKRFPAAPFFAIGFQLNTESPAVADLQPIIDDAHARQRSQQSVLDTYQSQGLPLDMVAKLLNVELPILMGELGRQGSDKFLFVEFHEDAAVQSSRAAVRDAKQVVLTRSALYTLSAFDFRQSVTGFEFLAPRSLVDEIQAELDEAEDRVRDGHQLLGTGDRGLALHKWPANHPILIAQRDALRDLLHWLDENAMVLPRPLEAFGDPKGFPLEFRSNVGPAAIDAIELACHSPATLYADDLGLRRLALSQGAKSFSSVALIQVLAERGAITAADRDRLLLGMLEHHYTAIRPTSELLAEAAKPDKSSAMRLATFHALSNGTVDLILAARVLVGAVRINALLPVRTTTSDAITRLGLEALVKGFSIAPAIRLVLKFAEIDLLLLPEHLQSVKDTCASFYKSRFNL